MSTSALFTLNARSLNVVVMACRTPGRLDALTLMIVLLVSPALSKLTVSAGSRPPAALPPAAAAARGAARSRRRTARAVRFVVVGAGLESCRGRRDETPKDSMAGARRCQRAVPSDGLNAVRLAAASRRRTTQSERCPAFNHASFDSEGVKVKAVKGIRALSTLQRPPKPLFPA